MITRRSVMAVLFGFVALCCFAHEAHAQTGRVRVRNASDVDVRAICISANPNVQFWVDVKQGMSKTEANVNRVPRSISFFEDLNDECIATKEFEFPAGKNIEVRINGTTGAYSISFAIWED